ncbi:MAG: hypothetical protein QF662_06955 [Phycisphaerae bacterium]|nr:hypothetical protein [Phycisphaerae bacterium]
MEDAITREIGQLVKDVGTKLGNSRGAPRETGEQAEDSAAEDKTGD